MQMLAISAGDACSLFTSWEPGRMGQFYFLTTVNLEDRAREWLDKIMNTLVNMYGTNKCVQVFGSNAQEMPREETKVHPDSFIMDYISTLQIEKNSNRERGDKERSPPDNRPVKKRALVVYGNSNLNAWNTPLMDKIDESTTISTPSKRIDLTKHEAETSVSLDTISQLSQDLVFLRKEFNDSIQLTNKNRDNENTAFMNKISTVQKSTDTSISDLTNFINGAHHSG